MTTLHVKKSIRRSPLRLGFLLIPLALTCFALLLTVQASPDPAPPPPSNTRDGQGSMAHITTGINNSAFGTNALNKLTTGNNNAAQGNGALFSLVDGDTNTGVGVLALRLNVGGSSNTAVGYEALYNTGSFNTAVGYKALFNNTSNFNTAVGYKALFNNREGFLRAAINTAIGAEALLNNFDGTGNTATGFQALVSNGEGSNNTAIGHGALRSNDTESDNVAVGGLRSNVSGFANVAVGNGALDHSTGDDNTAIGDRALFHNTSGTQNTAIGTEAGFSITGSGNVCIGASVPGVAGESNTTRIRNVYASVATARAVYVTSSNKIGTLASSRRFKDDIQPMDKASEAVLALKPVSFRYKQEVDPDRIPMFGLVAEEVEKVNPDLVSRDEEGKAFTVRYEAVNAMLLNEFLKAHRKMEEQEATIVQLKQDFQSKFAEQQKQIKALTTGLEKVNNQLELSKPAPQMVGNNR